MRDGLEMAPQTVRKLLNTLKHKRQVYISAYRYNSRGRPVRVWAVGAGKDAKVGEPPMRPPKKDITKKDHSLHIRNKVMQAARQGPLAMMAAWGVEAVGRDQQE